MVDKNTQVTLSGISSINDFNRFQLDILAHTYSYRIQEANRMKPHDYQPAFKVSDTKNTLEYKVTHLNLPHPLIQLRFNVHDSNHKSSCFK